MTKEKNYYYVPQELTIIVIDGPVYQTEVINRFWEKELEKEKLDKMAHILGRPDLVDKFCEPSLSFKTEIKEGKLILKITSWSGAIDITQEQETELAKDETLSELVTAIGGNSMVPRSLTHFLIKRGFIIRQYKEYENLITEITHPSGIASVEIDLSMKE